MRINKHALVVAAVALLSAPALVSAQTIFRRLGVELYHRLSRFHCFLTFLSASFVRAPAPRRLTCFWVRAASSSARLRTSGSITSMRPARFTTSASAASGVPGGGTDAPSAFVAALFLGHVVTSPRVGVADGTRAQLSQYATTTRITPPARACVRIIASRQHNRAYRFALKAPPKGLGVERPMDAINVEPAVPREAKGFCELLHSLHRRVFGVVCRLIADLVPDPSGERPNRRPTSTSGFCRRAVRCPLHIGRWGLRGLGPTSSASSPVKGGAPEPSGAAGTSSLPIPGTS